ncbi:MAG: helix-turn-helix domain-containing protein [Candidatus Hodarchaeota archaeon]
MIKTKETCKSPQLLKNDLLVLEVLRCTGSATRSELIVRCDLPRTTVYDSLVRLKRKGFVERYTEPCTIPGHPKIFFLLSVAAICFFLQQQEKKQTLFKMNIIQDDFNQIECVQEN